MRSTIVPLLALAVAGASDVRVEAPALGKEHVGQRVVVEGVLQSRAGQGERTKLRLERCEASFVVDDKLLGELRTKDNVSIVGKVRLGHDGGPALEVSVSGIQRLPSDVARFDVDAKALAPDDDAGWRKLAGWATRRHQLYGDPELGGRARIALQNALAGERKAASGNATKLAAIRERLQREGVDDFDFDGLDHEIFRAELASLEKPSAQRLRAMAAAVREKLLPPSGPAPQPPGADELARYEADPVSWYLLADARARRKLANYLQASLLVRAVQLDLDSIPQSATGQLTVLEAAVAELAGDRANAATLVEKASSKLLKRMEDLDDKEVARLATLVQTTLADRPRADRIRESWLLGQFERLKETERLRAEQAARVNAAPPALDAQARLRLAALWMEWFPESPDARAAAARCLKEALQINSKLDEAEQRLRKLGFRPRSNGEWESEDRGVGSSSGAPSPAAASIRVGDKAEKVRESLGAPSVQTRVVGKDWISHVWQYEGVTFLLREEPRTGYCRVAAIVSRRRTSRE